MYFAEGWKYAGDTRSYIVAIAGDPDHGVMMSNYCAMVIS